MPEVVDVCFKQAGPTYHFDTGGLDLKVGETVVVRTERGLSLAHVISETRQVSDEELEQPLKSVERVATQQDLSKQEELKEKEKEALQKCSELVAKHELPMKLIAAEYTLDDNHVTVFFSAERKVDFRAVVKNLSTDLKTRVELRQVGARDAAKLVGGLGKCGRPLCCITHIRNFDSISVKMAREQDLPLNPSKISGICDRLLCCLKYEYEQYIDVKARLPSVGKSVSTPQGKGKVTEVNVPKEKVTVQLESEATLEFNASQVRTLEV